MISGRNVAAAIKIATRYKIPAPSLFKLFFLLMYVSFLCKIRLQIFVLFKNYIIQKNR